MLYHVFIAYSRKGEKLLHSFIYDFSEETLKKEISVPFMRNQPLLIVGSFFSPASISKILIWKSEAQFKELILPNGESPDKEPDDFYIATCFNRGEVKGYINECTSEFISLPSEKEATITSPKALGEKATVFIVHGRDDKPALQLQKYLRDKLKLDAVSFEDFREESGSKTIIELLEHIKNNAAYAFVIITPDDVGCLREDIDKLKSTALIGKEKVQVQKVLEILQTSKTRARQNVVFEHGLFIGTLGRDNVCCLLHKDTQERPTDIDGILYVGFDRSVGETFPEITEKLKKAGLVTK